MRMHTLVVATQMAPSATILQRHHFNSNLQRVSMLIHQHVTLSKR